MTNITTFFALALHTLSGTPLRIYFRVLIPFSQKKVNGIMVTAETIAGD